MEFRGIPSNLECASFSDTSSPMKFQMCTKCTIALRTTSSPVTQCDQIQEICKRNMHMIRATCSFFCWDLMVTNFINIFSLSLNWHWPSSNYQKAGMKQIWRMCLNIYHENTQLSIKHIKTKSKWCWRPMCVNSLIPSDAYISVQHTNPASDNGLPPVCRQDIIWTDAAILSIRP